MMIIIAGASLSEQHTDLLAQSMCHAQVDIYVSHKPTARTATVSVATYARTKLYTLHVASCISDVTCRLCMALQYLKRPQPPS